MRDPDLRYAPANAGEEARANAFLDPERGQDFLHARHTMRALVSETTERPADAVSLLAPDDAAPGISGAGGIAVSWSRSGPVAMAGLLSQGRIGVDIERIVPRPIEAMLKMIAAPGEAGLVLAGEREPERLLRFYRLWTAKEALLKWQGSGLRGGAKRVAVPKSHLLGESVETQLTLDGAAVTLLAPEAPGGCIAAIAFSC